MRTRGCGAAGPIIALCAQALQHISCVLVCQLTSCCHRAGCRRAQAYIATQDYVEAEGDIKKGLAAEAGHKELQVGRLEGLVGGLMPSLHCGHLSIFRTCTIS